MEHPTCTEKNCSGGIIGSESKVIRLCAQNWVGLAEDVFPSCLDEAREFGDHNLFYAVRRAAKTGRRDKNEALPLHGEAAMFALANPSLQERCQFRSSKKGSTHP